jgi:hypothetical protein
MYELRLAQVEAYGSSDVTTVAEVTANWVEFAPQAAPVRVTTTRGAGEGALPIAAEVDNVDETATLWYARPMDGLRQFNAALETARRWALSGRRDMRMVLQMRNQDRNAHWYEATLYGGTAQPNGNARTATVQWTREPYWRGPEGLLQVRTFFDEAWGDFATIYNCDDGRPGYNNFVLVEAPVGNVPALTRIRISNNYATGRLAEVRMGWYDRPINLVLEAESSEIGVTLQYGTQFSNTYQAEGSTFRWEVEYASNRDFVGPFRVLANGQIAGDRWRVAVGYELTRMQIGRWAEGVNGWTDLGMVVLPPGGYTHPLRYPFKVWVESEDGSNGWLDFVHFIPMEQYRRLRFQGYNALPGTCIEDDGIRDELVYDYDSQRLPILDGYGGRIQLLPEAMLPSSKQQIITFGLESDTGVAEAERTAQVQILAVPRWNVLPDA